MIIGGFFIFAPAQNQQIVFEQPTPPEKIITLPPQIKTEEDLGIDLSPPPDEKLELPPPKEIIKILPPPLPAETLVKAEPPRKLVPQPELYAKGLLATVNFLCPNANGTYGVATGAIIDPHGYIISNAHIVDQKNQQPTCTIRRGSPAVDIGKAKLILLPAEYFATTDQQLQARMDISLWKLEGNRVDWPHWNIDFDTTPRVGEQLLTQSYPAELLSNELVFKNLNLLFSNTIITETDASIIASRATIAAQHGSSGGMLIDPYTGMLRGIIFGISSDTEKSINTRILYAIAPTRINSIIWQETKKQFREYLAALPEPTY